MAEKPRSIKSHDCLNDPTSDCKSGVIVDHQSSDCRATVTIDHHYFPHIIDLILSFLPYPGLIRCTAVCKNWREHARNRLFDHVAVFEQCSDGGGLVEVWSRSVDWPELTVNLVSADDDEFQAFEKVYKSSTVEVFYQSFEHSSQTGYPWSRPRRYPRVLNGGFADGTYPPDEDRGFMAEDMTWEDVVYFVSYQGGRFDFGEGTTGCPDTVTITISCYLNPTETEPPGGSAVWPQVEDFCYEIEGAEKIIIVLLNFTDAAPQFSEPSCLRTVTFASAVNKGSSPSRRKPTHPELGALSELIFCSARQPYVESVDVVGLEGLMSAHKRMPYTQSICDAIVATIDGMEGGSDPEGLPCVQDFLRFYTHEQFRDNVGEERYQLVTVQ